MSDAAVARFVDVVCGKLPDVEVLTTPDVRALVLRTSPPHDVKVAEPADHVPTRSPAGGWCCGEHMLELDDTPPCDCRPTVPAGPDDCEECDDSVDDRCPNHRPGTTPLHLVRPTTHTAAGVYDPAYPPAYGLMTDGPCAGWSARVELTHGKPPVHLEAAHPGGGEPVEYVRHGVLPGGWAWEYVTSRRHP